MLELERLTPAQRRALAHVERESLRRQSEATGKLRAALAAESIPETVFDAAVTQFRTRAKVALAFHPERVVRSGRTVAEGLLSDGIYRNQYETGISSGSTTAFAGGSRDEWERRLFGGAYHGREVGVEERPKYGALFLVAHPDGPCPRFGSCYLVLRREVSERCSFTPLGSQEDLAPEQTGTLNAPEPTLSALADHITTYEAPLGIKQLTVRRFITEMSAGLPISAERNPLDPNGRALDSFVEAQVHGPVELERDVEAVVADSSFRGSQVGQALTELTARYWLSLHWHPGFRLEAAAFPVMFRGYVTRRLAERVAKNGVVDAPSLGAGHNDFIANPGAWAEFGSRSDTLTSFRRVWHFLVLAGQPSTQWERGASGSDA